MSADFPHLSKALAKAAWYTPFTCHLPVDPSLLEAFAEILNREMSKPNLGCATTGQLLDEIRARVDCNYSTVG